MVDLCNYVGDVSTEEQRILRLVGVIPQYFLDKPGHRVHYGNALVLSDCKLSEATRVGS